MEFFLYLALAFVCYKAIFYVADKWFSSRLPSEVEKAWEREYFIGYLRCQPAEHAILWEHNPHPYCCIRLFKTKNGRFGVFKLSGQLIGKSRVEIKLIEEDEAKKRLFDVDKPAYTKVFGAIEDA